MLPPVATLGRPFRLLLLWPRFGASQLKVDGVLENVRYGLCERIGKPLEMVLSNEQRNLPKLNIRSAIESNKNPVDDDNPMECSFRGFMAAIHAQHICIGNL